MLILCQYVMATPYLAPVIFYRPSLFLFHTIGVFYSFPFAIVIVAHLGSLRAGLGSVSASFRIVSVPRVDLKVSLT